MGMTTAGREASTAAKADALPPEELRSRVEALGPWFHNFDLGGVRTAPDHFLGDYPAVKFAGFADRLPDVRGKSVLDIGCNAGFYSMEMKKRGAARVLGVDSDDRYLDQARLAARALGTDGIEFAKLSVFDVAALGERFDLVIFMGVFYHLRHPLLALDLIREHVAGDMLLFQSLQRGSEEVAEVAADYPFSEAAVFDQPGYPKMHFVEGEYCGDWTNWWFPNRAGTEAMLRSAGFGIADRLEQEVYLCRVESFPDDQKPWRCAYPARGAQEVGR